MSTADPPHPLAGSRSQRQGRRAYRPTPCDGEHQDSGDDVQPSLGMWRECHPTFQLTKHCDYRSKHHSVDDLTVIGSAALVAPTTAGSTNSARTISAHLLTYGEQPSSVVTLKRRYGPRRLRDDDDDVNRVMSSKCGLQIVLTF